MIRVRCVFLREKFIEIKMKLQLDTLIIWLIAINNQMRIKRLFIRAKDLLHTRFVYANTVHAILWFFTCFFFQ